MTATKREPVDWPDPGCVCRIEGCICLRMERSLRGWSQGLMQSPMSAEQREVCLLEIDSVEGYRREDYVDVPDGDLARGVLSAWRDYCRDKGML